MTGSWSVSWVNALSLVHQGLIWNGCGRVEVADMFKSRCSCCGSSEALPSCEAKNTFSLLHLLPHLHWGQLMLEQEHVSFSLKMRTGLFSPGAWQLCSEILIRARAQSESCCSPPSRQEFAFSRSQSVTFVLRARPRWGCPPAPSPCCLHETPTLPRKSWPLLWKS